MAGLISQYAQQLEPDEWAALATVENETDMIQKHGLLLLKREFDGFPFPDTADLDVETYNNVRTLLTGHQDALSRYFRYNGFYIGQNEKVPKSSPLPDDFVQKYETIVGRIQDYTQVSNAPKIKDPERVSSIAYYEGHGPGPNGVLLFAGDGCVGPRNQLPLVNDEIVYRDVYSYLYHMMQWSLRSPGLAIFADSDLPELKHVHRNDDSLTVDGKAPLMMTHSCALSIPDLLQLFFGIEAVGYQGDANARYADLFTKCQADRTMTLSVDEIETVRNRLSADYRGFMDMHPTLDEPKVIQTVCEFLKRTKTQHEALRAISDLHTFLRMFSRDKCNVVYVGCPTRTTRIRALCKMVLDRDESRQYGESVASEIKWYVEGQIGPQGDTVPMDRTETFTFERTSDNTEAQ